METLLGDILFTLQDISYLFYNITVPDYGYLFVSTTILMFIHEFKNQYKIKKLEKQVKVLIKDLKESKVSQEWHS